MNIRLLVALSMGAIATGAYAAGDAYDVMNPHESMNPWKATKGELRMCEKRVKAYERFLEKKGFGYYWTPQDFRVMPNQDGNITPAGAKWYHLQNDWRNKYYFSEPKFPRVKWARKSLRLKLDSWLK
jgi:hypothetical protein